MDIFETATLFLIRNDIQSTRAASESKKQKHVFKKAKQNKTKRQKKKGFRPVGVEPQTLGV